MPMVNDRCICLRKTEYSETSQILTLFTRTYGIVRLMAKGAHRRTKAGASKFDGGIDFLDVGVAVFQHDPARDLPLIIEWNLREGHLALRKTLRGICLGLYAGEMIDRLIEEHDPHEPLFDRLEATLPALATARREEFFLAFELDLLRESGYLPELSLCVGCGTPQDGSQPLYFSSADGGIICRNCEMSVPGRIEQDPRLIRLLQTMLRLPKNQGEIVRLPQLTRHQTDPINRMLALHIEHTLGQRLRMPKWILAR
jgi:DNA repair protein RecO (recombination protein O)